MYLFSKGCLNNMVDPIFKKNYFVGHLFKLFPHLIFYTPKHHVLCMYLFFPNYPGTTSTPIQNIVAWYYRQPSYYYYNYYCCCLPLTIHSTPPLWKTEAKNNMCDDDDMSYLLLLFCNAMHQGRSENVRQHKSTVYYIQKLI